jgi:RimJ/RimL family protein N-acetyltransferase
VLQRPTLLTDRLHLRTPMPADAPAIVQLVGDRDVARQLARVPHPYGPDDARFFLDQVVPTEWVWAVTRRASGDLIGMAGLTPVPDQAAELGTWLGRPHWGQGFVTEAARAVLGYGFGALGLSEVAAGHFVDNPASGRVLAKLGFVEIGRGELGCLATGESRAAVRMRVEVGGWGVGVKVGWARPFPSPRT